MSMEINAYNSYAAETANNSKSTSKKESATSETKQYSSVNEYTKALSEKFDYFGKTASVHGVPTTVKVSSACLKKCVNDPEMQKTLEHTLSVIPDAVAYGNSHCYGTQTYVNYEIGEDGTVTRITGGGTNDPDGRIARENAEKKAKEQKEKEEKLEKKRAERKEQEEQLAEQRAKRKEEREALQSHEVTVVGSDVWSATEKYVEKVNGSKSSAATVSGTVGFDIKA